MGSSCLLLLTAPLLLAAATLTFTRPQTTATLDARDLGCHINVNTAAPADLRLLPGVGARLAERIEAGRPYQTSADLDTVHGIGDRTIHRISPYITFTPAP